MSYTQTVITEEVKTTSRISLNKGFIKCPAGILKLIELIIDIIIWICVGSSETFYYLGNGRYVNFAATFSFICTFILFILYLFQIIYRLPGPWVLIESCSILLSIIFLAIAILIAAISFHHVGAIAAAVFCALNSIVYGVEMFLRFRISRSGGFLTATAVDGDISIKTTTITEERSARNDQPMGQAEFGDSYGVP